MDVVYRAKSFAKTRRQALWFLVGYVILIAPLVVESLGRGRLPRQQVAILVLAATPVLVARLCWRFLDAAERNRSSPTPEMEFVFRLMTASLIGIGSVVFFVLRVL